MSVNFEMTGSKQHSHVGSVRLQAAYDHGDGSEWIWDVTQHHTWRFGPRQDVVHKAQHGL